MDRAEHGYAWPVSAEAQISWPWDRLDAVGCIGLAGERIADSERSCIPGATFATKDRSSDFSAARMQPSVRGTENAPCMFHSQEWAGMSSVSPAPAFFRIRDVLRITALSRPTLYRRIAARRFPPPVHLGGRACGWPSAALQAWITDPEGYCAPEEPHTLVSRKRGSPRKHPVYRTEP